MERNKQPHGPNPCHGPNGNTGRNIGLIPNVAHGHMAPRLSSPSTKCPDALERSDPACDVHGNGNALSVGAGELLGYGLAVHE
jgi:hypothetical protein